MSNNYNENEINKLLATFKQQDKNARRNARRQNEASINEMQEDFGFELMDKTINIELDYEKKELMETLAAAIATLNVKQQRLIWLYYYENKTIRQIAVLFGIHFSNIHRQIETIHKILKKILENFYD